MVYVVHNVTAEAEMCCSEGLGLQEEAKNLNTYVTMANPESKLQLAELYGGHTDQESMGMN